MAFAQARDGPVQFEKDSADPFNIDEMIRDVTGGAGGNKRHMKEPLEAENSKRSKS